MIHSDILYKEYCTDIHLSGTFPYYLCIISVGLFLIICVVYPSGTLFVLLYMQSQWGLCLPARVYLSGAFVVCLYNTHCRVWPY